MSKKLLFAIIATICATTAFADTKTLTTQDYVDAQDATKQTKIPLGSLEIDTGKTTWGVPHSLISYPTTTIGEIGEYGIMDVDFMSLENGGDIVYEANQMTRDIVSNMIPTSDVIGNTIIYETGKKQGKIPKSGFSHSGSSNTYVDSYSSHPNWFDVAGTGLVTRTSEDGQVGERKIFETSDVSGYHATGLTQAQKDIQDISIPTVGAMMNAIANGVSAGLPTGTAGNVVTYNSNGAIGGSVATYNGSTTYNASTDASKIAVMSAVQRKMTCNRYLENAAQTPENCLLWNIPD
ncbi:MAG: hypothetical protein J5620_04260 [Alphaproteobacteria bacterium]|nr:hypothetical protein [Alphaproteobacteria bacterium]